MPLGTEVGLGSGHVVLDGDPAPLPRKGAEQPPTFRPMSIEPNGRPSQQLLTSCTFADSKNIFGKLLQKV